MLLNPVVKFPSSLYLIYQQQLTFDHFLLLETLPSLPFQETTFPFHFFLPATWEAPSFSSVGFSLVLECSKPPLFSLHAHSLGHLISSNGFKYLLMLTSTKFLPSSETFLSSRVIKPTASSPCPKRHFKYNMYNWLLSFPQKQWFFHSLPQINQWQLFPSHLKSSLIPRLICFCLYLTHTHTPFTMSNCKLPSLVPGLGNSVFIGFISPPLSHQSPFLAQQPGTLL